MLVEDTPALDTYEARQRGRLIIGALVAGCFGIFGWIFYNLFIYDPNPMVVTTGDEPPPPVTVAPAPKKDLDLEAQSMFDRAREDAKAGRTDQAITLLETVVKSYQRHQNGRRGGRRRWSGPSKTFLSSWIAQR